MRAKTIFLKAVLLAIFVALIGSVPGTRADSGMHYFRHEILTKSGDFRYAEAISLSESTTGTYYEVETDDQGRVAKVTEIRDGKPSSVRRYQFGGSEKLASGYDETNNIAGRGNGRRGGTFRIQRMPTGNRKRTDRIGPKGELLSYITYEDAADHVEEFTFGADGKQTGHRAYYFTPSGDCHRRITYFGNAELDSDIDDATGLEKTTKQIDVASGQTATQKFTYGPDGDAIRVDVFDSAGEKFATQDYIGDLVSRRLYNHADGTTKEIRYVYDGQKLLTTARIYFNGKIVCSLNYDRLADGAIKQTLALGPDGELWAEYPAPEVVDIQDNGQPINRTDGVIHKSGLWWGNSAQPAN